MGDENKNSDKMKQTLIDFNLNLQRIKQAETGINPELDYQLKIYKNKLSALGIPPEDYEK